jgi:hypothetical protein
MSEVAYLFQAAGHSESIRLLLARLVICVDNVVDGPSQFTRQPKYEGEMASFLVVKSFSNRSAGIHFAPVRPRRSTSSQAHPCFETR